MEDTKEKIEVIFDSLQELDAKPTPHNVSILDGVYGLLRCIYNELEKTGETENGRATDQTK